MAQFSVTLTYPDNKQIELRDILASEFGYLATIDDGQGNQIPNPQSKVAFIQERANEHLRNWIQNIYRAGKERAAVLIIDSNLGATI